MTFLADSTDADAQPHSLRQRRFHFALAPGFFLLSHA